MTMDIEIAPLAATEPYRARLATATELFTQVNQRWHRVANLRLVAFVAAAAAAAWAIWGQAPVGWPLAALLLLAFIALAVYHARLGRERARHATMQAVQRDAIARIERRWADLPTPWQPPVPPDHPYAFDLDIVGRASLLQLLNTTATRMGRETLACLAAHRIATARGAVPAGCGRRIGAATRPAPGSGTSRPRRRQRRGRPRALSRLGGGTRLPERANLVTLVCLAGPRGARHPGRRQLPRAHTLPALGTFRFC